MGLSKAKGNMYKWATHTHRHLVGRCPHRCKYCYVQDIDKKLQARFGRPPLYAGDPQFKTDELDVNYGAGKTIFIEHMGDMFANAIPADWINHILAHCNMYKNNRYIFQTKNPLRAYDFCVMESIPKTALIGTTIETNRAEVIAQYTEAPSIPCRVSGIAQIMRLGWETFITIEPIMKFDLAIFSSMLIEAKPSFINIGADSKGCNLPEPSSIEILNLINALRDAGIEVNLKDNLKRLFYWQGVGTGHRKEIGEALLKKPTGV